MTIATTLGNFFLSELLWSITWDIYLIPCAIILMTLFIKIGTKTGIIPAFLISSAACITSFLVFTGLTILLLTCIFQFEYSPSPEPMIMPLAACLWLGAIYTFFQTIFFMALNQFYSLNVRRFAIIGGIAQLITALFMNLFISLSYT